MEEKKRVLVAIVDKMAPSLLNGNFHLCNDEA